MRVAARDLGVARLARRGLMAQEVGDVVLVYVRRPKSRGEGVPEVVEVEIADPRLLDGLLETDHQLAALPARALRVEDPFFLGRILPHSLQDSERRGSCGVRLTDAALLRKDHETTTGRFTADGWVTGRI